MSRTEFELDDFQIEAANAIRAGESVVVTAPTGSGKTLVAQFAIERALARRKKAFYTTPLKALSNQKYHDFGQLFPDVGLLTGDNSINGDAPLVVMTTEVLRNMIYAASPTLENLDVVVLDEVHYLQDPTRGAVWEEIIVHAPPATQLVCLSATLSNAGEFATWVRSRRGPTRLVQEDRRPVPLVNLYAVKDRWHDEVVLQRMFERGRVSRSLEERISGRRAGRYGSPRRGETVAALAAEDRLPVIYFIFSRAGCDDAARRLVDAGARFTDASERDAIVKAAEARTGHIDARDLATLGYDRWLYGLEAGVAPHHAGMVPAFKETVEELFARGLIKVVFATETLSLGINMPARTVVLESLSRYTGEGHELLRPGDYTQLTGRAGRRGIDEVGYGVVLHSRYVAFPRVAELASAGSHALASSFRPSYNMAVNLIANHPRQRAEELLNASFGQFQASSGLERKRRSLIRQERDLEVLTEAASCERGDVGEYRSHLRQTGPLDVGDIVEVPAIVGRFLVVKRHHGKRVELEMVSEQGRLSTVPQRVWKEATKVGWTNIHDLGASVKDRSVRRELAKRMIEAPAEHPVATCPDRARHIEAYDKLAKVQRRVERLRQSIARASGGLVRELDRILALLEELGYVRGWSLTEAGERLRSLYSDTDLVLSEAMRAGLFEGLDSPETAALAAMTVYEPRRAEAPVGRFPSPRLGERGPKLEALWSGLAEKERRLGLATSRAPERGFVMASYRWTAGYELDEILGSSEAGDFVRTSRQLLDVLRQMRDTVPAMRATISEAIRAMDRGVVAAPQ
jgi:ATP-dependent RNA helicase HelY